MTQRSPVEAVVLDYFRLVLAQMILEDRNFVTKLIDVNQ